MYHLLPLSWIISEIRRNIPKAKQKLKFLKFCISETVLINGLIIEFYVFKKIILSLNSEGFPHGFLVSSVALFEKADTILIPDVLFAPLHSPSTLRSYQGLLIVPHGLKFHNCLPCYA